MRLLASVMPMQAEIRFLWISSPQQLLRKILNITFLLRKYLQVWQGLAVRRNRVNFGRDKFTGYFFAPFIDALTAGRHHIKMRGCRYYSSATHLLGFCSMPVSYKRRITQKDKSERLWGCFHNLIDAFRRKAGL